MVQFQVQTSGAPQEESPRTSQISKILLHDHHTHHPTTTVGHSFPSLHSKSQFNIPLPIPSPDSRCSTKRHASTSSDWPNFPYTTITSITQLQKVITLLTDSDSWVCSLADEISKSNNKPRSLRGCKASALESRGHWIRMNDLSHTWWWRLWAF